MPDNLRCQFPPECSPDALFDCDYVFSDVVVIPAREGGTIVQWVLHPQVRDYGEYRYTLQVGNAGVDDPRAWKSIVFLRRFAGFAHRVQSHWNSSLC